MFEQALVRGTAHEAFTQCYERSKICNGIRREMVKLCAEEIQEPMDEWMGRQRKTSLNVGEEEDSLAFMWLWLGLSLRQPP